MSVLLGYLGRERVSAAQLERLYEQGKARPGFATEVVAALAQLDPDIAHRAVWLLRKLAGETRLDDAAMRRVVEYIDASGHWIFRLTLCQLFAETDCPRDVADDVRAFLRKNVEDRRVIIRAWALTALMRMPRELVSESERQQLWRAAERDPAKSMQARLRLLKRRLAARRA